MSNRFISGRNDVDSYLDDDIDDASFLNKWNAGHNSNEWDREKKIQQMVKVRADLENKTLQSAQRSIGLLATSEQVGTHTAEELTRQREQLERTDRRLDHISDTLKYSQKQINGIKSVFGSVKNYFSSRKDDSLPPETSELKKTDDISCTPTVTGKDPNDPIALPKSAAQNVPAIKCDNYNRSETSATIVNQMRQTQSSSDCGDKLNSNLDEMCTALSRLRGLAQGLTTELDEQNHLISSVITKTDLVGVTIHSQNEQVKKLLKK